MKTKLRAGLRSAALATAALATVFSPFASFLGNTAYATTTLTSPITNNNLVELTSDEHVSFTKSAAEVTDENGKVVPGQVDITLTAKGPYTPVPEDVYVVIVFDRSGSMTSNNSQKWANAKKATIDFSKDLAKNDDITAHMSIVNFNAEASTPATGWQTSAFTDNSTTFPSSSGMTNLQDGIAEAVNKLGEVDSPYKYIVVMSDGQPTACRTTTGDSYSNCISGTSATNIKSIVDSKTTSSNSSNSSAVAKYVQVAKDVADAAKSAEGVNLYGNITFLTIGYDIGNTSNSTHNTARSTLEYIASNSSMALLAGVDDLEDTFAKLLPEVASIPAGENATITDIIGSGFTFVDALSNVSENENGEYVTKNDKGQEVVTCNFATITNKVDGSNSCTFRIELDVDDLCFDVSVNDYFLTNKSAQLAFTPYEYTLVNGVRKYTKDSTTASGYKLGKVTTLNVTDSPVYNWTDELLSLLDCPIPGEITVGKSVTDLNPDDEFLPDSETEFEFLITLNKTKPVWKKGANDYLVGKCYVYVNGVEYGECTDGMTISLKLKAGETAVITTTFYDWISSVTVEEVGSYTHYVLPEKVTNWTWTEDERNYMTMEFGVENTYDPVICEFDETLLSDDENCKEPGKGGDEDPIITPILTPVTGTLGLGEGTGTSNIANTTNYTLIALASGALLIGAAARKKAKAVAKEA